MSVSGNVSMKRHLLDDELGMRRTLWPPHPANDADRFSLSGGIEVERDVQQADVLSNQHPGVGTRAKGAVIHDARFCRAAMFGHPRHPFPRSGATWVHLTCWLIPSNFPTSLFPSPLAVRHIL